MSKRSKKKKGLGTCAFCGQPATTEDHVPPRGMYAPRTPYPPWVPACAKCNQGASQDDQFMQRLALMWGAERTKDGVAVTQKILRSLDYPEQRGFNRTLIRNLSPVNILSPGGLLWLGRTLRLQMDNKRLYRVLNKIVRGWFWRVKKRPFPAGYSIVIHLVGAAHDDPDFRENERHILDYKEVVVGDRAFSIRWASSPDDDNISLWRLEFYATAAYMAYTVKDMGDYRVLLKLSDAKPSAPAAVA